MRNPDWCMNSSNPETANVLFLTRGSIRLHAAAAYPSSYSSLFAPYSPAAIRCSNAVSQFSAMTHWVLQQYLIAYLGPPFAFGLWVASRLLLVQCVWNKSPVTTEINPLLTALSRMRKYWKVCDQYQEILQLVIDEYEGFRDQEPFGTENFTQSSEVIKIFCDMRRCAFEVCVLITKATSC
ncbi:hypothetical protein EIK77_003684 [Talaromyces pinophilus]|nr:hypothetical protein EIK77_003684 [Talaromyces pinophilus]